MHDGTAREYINQLQREVNELRYKQHDILGLIGALANKVGYSMTSVEATPEHYEFMEKKK